MTGERLARLQALFEGALEQPAEHRRTWVEAQESDADLRREVLALLRADGDGLTLENTVVQAFTGTPVLAGRSIGRYRVLGEIGSGGMGTVLLAERADDTYHQRVAIKLVRGLPTSDVTERMKRERQVLADLAHPNIARLLDGGNTESGEPFLVMEHIEGMPLDRWCATGALDVKARVQLVESIARAVHFAHQRLIVHRDIKPANVMVRADGTPVLLDFGIAKLLDADARSGSASETGHWFTPAYASPEQRRGAGVSTVSDVYSLGLLLHAVLTDLAPDPDLRGNVPPPSTLAPLPRRAQLRGDLDRIVAKAADPDPALRYASAEAMANDVERWRRGEPVRATRGGTAYRARKWLRRHPALAAVSVLALASALFFTWRLANERDRAVRAEALAWQHSKDADAVTTFLSGLFREATPGGSADRSLTPEELIDRGRDRLAEASVAPSQRARLANVLGEIYIYLGKPDKAAAMLDIAVPNAVEAGRPADELSSLWRALAIARADQGERGGATLAHERSLAYARASGDKQSILLSLSGLGSSYVRSDRMAEGEKVLRESLALAIELHGTDSVDTARDQSYLAEALAFTGRREEAQPLIEQAIATMRRHRPPDDYQLLRLLSRYGAILLAQRKPKEAEKVLLELVAQRTRLQGEDSAMLANAYNGLGAVYYEQGRIPEAEVQTAAALATASAGLSPDDPVLSNYQNSYAVVLVERGDYAKAEAPMRAAMAGRERVAAGRHELNVVMSRQNLGRLLLLKGDPEEARALLEMPVGEGESTGWALNRALQRLSLALWHVVYGDAAAALPLLDESEAKVDELGGKESWRYGTLLRYRGLALASLDRREEAAPILSAALEVWRTRRGVDYVGCGEIALDLAELARASGDRAQVQRWLAEARRILDPVLVAHAPQRERLEKLKRYAAG